MKMHRIAIGVALVALPGLALAQTQTQTPSTGSCADKQQIGCTDTFYQAAEIMTHEPSRGGRWT